jgi:DNA-binding CsgD family transcriptional regulator
MRSDHGDEYLVISYPTTAHAAFTPSEREVLSLVALGQSNASIARARGVSRHTVANQIASAFRKLGIRSRSELAAIRIDEA